jgi:FkbM family methyltransferase
MFREGTLDEVIVSEVEDVYWLPKLAELLREREHVNVLDVGGHIGSFSALLASALPHMQGDVYEMMPENAAMARMNVALNELQRRVSIHNAVISDATGTINVRSQLVTHATNTGGTSVAGHDFDTEDTGDVGLVPVKTADEVFNSYDRVDLWKLDCEGSEFRIVFSLSPNNLSKVETIVGEIHENRETRERQTGNLNWTAEMFYGYLGASFPYALTAHRHEYEWGFTESFLVTKNKKLGESLSNLPR